MSTIVTRSGKGSPLSHVEVDANFTNLNTDKIQSGNTVAALTVTSATINGGSINATTVGATTATTGAFTTATANSFIPNLSTVPTNGLYLPAANSVGFSTNSAERMRIDSSGNVGIGVTPSAWWSSIKALQIGGSSSFNDFSSSGNRQTTLANNAFLNASVAWAYVNTDPASRYQQIGGQHQWYNAPSGTAGNPITFTQAMTLDNSGNLGIGVVPSAWAGTAGKALQVNNLTIGQNIGFDVSVLTTNGYATSGSAYNYIGTAATAQYKFGSAGHTWLTAPSGTAGTAITFTQVLAVEKDKSLALQGATSQTGAGITFPFTQVASTDANTLDDYEEGTWTPVVGGTATYTAQVGKYTKIGNVVTLYAQLIINVLGTGSTTAISGLPFNFATGSDYISGSVGYHSGLATNVLYLRPYYDPGSAVNVFFANTTISGTGMSVQAPIFGNSARVAFTITYYV